MRLILTLVALVWFVGCTINTAPYMTFEEVSAPYLSIYGPPEDESKYTSEGYSSVDWWWWTKGFEVTFVNTTYDEVNGWMVDSTYTFEPISAYGTVRSVAN